MAQQSFSIITSTLIQSRNRQGAHIDIFQSAKQANIKYFDTIQEILDSMEDGIGIAKMTQLTTRLQLIQSQAEYSQNIFSFVKNFENKLENLLSA
ncbi:hypothetical protein HOH87_07110 [bacterium]|jgi:hypothetical protein|nr:hypothetical protein [bacterium]